MGHLSPPDCLRWPCAVQEPKFKILLPRSCVPKPIEYMCNVSSMSAQGSRSLRVLTDGHLIGFISHLTRDD